MTQLETGSQILKIDNQGRIKLPTANVDYFKARGNLMMTLDAYSQCLVVMPLAVWEEKAKKVMQLSSAFKPFRTIKRRFVGNAKECEIDSSCRIAIPKLMRQMVDIEESCVFVAQENKFEIFSEANWLAMIKEEINLTEVPSEEVIKNAENLNI